MTCSYCGTRNGEDDNRCRRCGRRPGDRLTGEFTVPRTDGALAPQILTSKTPMERPGPRLQPRVARGPAQPAEAAVHSAPKLPGRAVQASLFPESPAPKVIPIAGYAPLVLETPPPAAAQPGSQPHAKAPAKPVVKPAPRRKPVNEAQSSLDFLPALSLPRPLSTTVEATIYCESPVATTVHRAVASALDWSMVLIGYGIFLLVFRLSGGEIVLTRSNLIVFGGMFLMMGFTYGLFFALAGAETPGMRWTELRLTTFDGFPAENATRLIRFAAAGLSRCTLLGLLWSLADEESLAWHDRISRTFPTPQRSESEIFRRR